MRISDERYRRDLRRLQLAWRLIQLDARTPTIERWTALSVYRIRRLRGTYAAEASRGAALKGVTPFRVEFFSKSATVKCEAPMLAGFLRHFGVLPNGRETSADDLPNLARGERFCRAYEQFRACRPDSEISFEHAVMLLTELVRGVEITLLTCTNCGELIVHDCLSARRPSCAYCLHEMHAGSSLSPARSTPGPPASPPEGDGGAGSNPQRSLF
jgi:hypothetical protein